MSIGPEPAVQVFLEQLVHKIQMNIQIAAMGLQVRRMLSLSAWHWSG